MLVRSLSSRLLLPVLVAAVAGCGSGYNNFKDPDIQLDHVVVRGAGLTGGNLDLVLKVYNPNGFTLQGTKLQVGFDVQDSHVGDITYKDEFRVTKQDTTQITLPLQFNWAGVGGALRSALGYGDIPYKLKGQATVQTPFGPRVIPFSKQGRAPLTRIGVGMVSPRGAAGIRVF